MLNNIKMKRIISMTLVCFLVITGVNWPEIKVKAKESNIHEFEYTGNVQTFTAPYTGLYKLEAWGANGGDARMVNSGTIANGSGGNGGYSSGEVFLEANQKIEIYVGGRGEDQSDIAEGSYGKGGWNGGGDGGTELAEDYPEAAAGGGGATDFRTSSATYSFKNLMKTRDEIIFGPYIAADSGIYLVEHYGRGLTESTVDAATNDGTFYETYNIEVTDTKVSYNVNLSEDIVPGIHGDGLEFRLFKSKDENFEYIKTVVTKVSPTANGIGSRILVAGGGGGAGSHISSTTVDIKDEVTYVKCIGGDGGGLEGTSYNDNNLKGTQISGYKLGIGRNGFTDLEDLNNVAAYGGGGGGYFGGTWDDDSTVWVDNSMKDIPSGGAGGSGYIGGVVNGVTLAGNQEIPELDNIISKSQGNGYAKITLLNSAPKSPSEIVLSDYSMYRNNTYNINWDSADDNEKDEVYYRISAIVDDEEFILDDDVTYTSISYFPKYETDKSLKIRVYSKDIYSDYHSYIETNIVTYKCNTAPMITEIDVSNINHKDEHFASIKINAKDNEYDLMKVRYKISSIDNAYSDDWIILGDIENGFLEKTIDYSSEKIHGTQYILIEVVDEYDMSSTFETTFSITSNKPSITFENLETSYNNVLDSENYTPSIDFGILIKDIDKDDSVTLSYYLDETTVLNQETINSNLIEGNSIDYTLDISKLDAGVHTIYLKATDTYNNTVIETKDFEIFKAPELKNIKVLDIDHSISHETEVTLELINDNANSTATIEYSFDDENWKILLSEKNEGIHVGYIDFKEDYNNISKNIKFRANNGLSSTVTEGQTFSIINNAPIIKITSTYDEHGYNNLPETEGYIDSLELSVDITDIDLDDIVKLSYKIDSEEYLDYVPISSELIQGTSHKYNINISSLKSGTHNFTVKATDRYNNVVEKSISFMIYKAPVITKVTVSDINHSDSHNVPVNIEFENNNVSSDINIEYKINDGSWTTFFDGEKTDDYSGTIDFASYYNKTSKVKFRIYNGHQHSAETDYYTFNLENNIPVINITSVYDAIGYNNVSGTDNYKEYIDLDIFVKDIDLDDIVTLSYGLNSYTYSNEIAMSEGLKDGFSHTYKIDISELDSGTYTLNVKAIDNYENIIEKNISFKIYKAPIINNVIVSDIDHSKNHMLEISVDFTDDNSELLTKIEYSLNNSDWKNLIENKKSGLYNATIDFSDNNNKGNQSIKFRAHNGIQYGNETKDYAFNIFTNKPEVTITSEFDTDGYDIFSNNDEYISFINLSGIVVDLDKDDFVTANVYLDDAPIKTITLTAREGKSLEDTFSLDIDIRGCTSSTHILRVDVVDKYNNTNTTSKTFITYKSPEFVKAIIENIDHKDTHILDMNVAAFDEDKYPMIIEYKLNNGDWVFLAENVTNEEILTSIDLKNNYIKDTQVIKFRASKEIENLGIKFSKESKEYTFKSTSNTPDVEITSDFDEKGYDTFDGNNNAVSTIKLNGGVADLDKDDSVTVNVYLDNAPIEKLVLNSEENKDLNDNFSLDIDITECASGTHTLRVDVVDKYNNTNTTSKTFITYKSPEFVKAIIENIDHKDTHNLPIEIVVDNRDIKYTNMTIEYQLNYSTNWIVLLENISSGTHKTTINLIENTSIEEQNIRFRVLNNMNELGIKYSDISSDYIFILTNNKPIVEITSNYDEKGYDTFSKNKTYTEFVNLRGTVIDLDKDDTIIVDIYLDDFPIKKIILNAEESKNLEDGFNLDVDIRGCISGIHTLRVDVIDRYNNTNTTSKNFITYKSPEFVEAIVENIDHKDTHIVPIKITVNDTDNKLMNIQYELNNNGIWIDLLLDKINGSYDATIDYSKDYTTKPQTIKFKALSTIPGLGVKESDESSVYNFIVTSNNPILNITSEYIEEGYNTAIESTNYVSEIILKGTLKDIDLGDVVKVEYSLDGKFIEEIVLSNNLEMIDSTYKFIVDISKLNADDKHLLEVTAKDLYGRSVTDSITFKTYVNNTSTFKSLIVESINHKDTHNVPIKFELYDKESDNILVEYKLRIEGEVFEDSWTTLVADGTNKKYTEYLDYETNYIQKNQYIKFRLYDGTTYSNETNEYLFTLKSNPSVINIKSDYSKDYYNTAKDSTNYVGEIPFSVNLTDIDLGDTVELKYYLDEVELDSLLLNNLKNSINEDFEFKIDISKCKVGEHTLLVTAIDNYNNNVSVSTKFKTYINYSPVIERVEISNINHDTTHLVPIDVTVNDKDEESMLIEYSLNGGDWVVLLNNKFNGTHHRDLDYTNDYTLGVQKIQFRLYDGTTYSNLSEIYDFKITSNDSVININSIYDENGYNTSTLSTNLKTNIPLNITVKDNDLGDLIKISYYLNNKLIEKVELTNGAGIKVDRNHEFDVNISSLTPGTNTLKVVGIDRYGNETITTRDFVTYSNNRIKIKNFNVTNESRFNGAIYINEDAKQDAFINITLEDSDDNNLEYFIDVDYDFDGTTFKNTKRFASNIITKTTKEKSVSLNIHQLLGNTDIRGTVRFRISGNDTRLNVAQRQYYDVSILNDNNSKVIVFTKNTNPEIINFNLPSNSHTLKNIYDVLMIGQTSKPNFNWLANAGTSDIYKNYEYGDEIVSYKILYSVNGWETSNNIATNLSQKTTSLDWLNNTGYDNARVQFKLVATDYFGAHSEKVLDDSYNYYLQINNAPKAPLSLTIRNLNKPNISYGERYTFDWGISSEPDAADNIVEYVFGYKIGSSISNYNELTVLYRGENRSYSNWKNVAKDEIIFAIYSIDRFGIPSELQTFSTSSIQNSGPNVVTSHQLKDVTFTSVDKGYIKKAETYALSWIDAGDPDVELGDSIQYWKVLYNINNGEWIETHTIKNSINLSIKNDGPSLNNVVNFKILAFDKFNEFSESKVFTYNYVTDLTGPTWVNSNKFKDESSNIGQKVHFDIIDNSGVSKVEIYNGSVLLGTLYNELIESNPLVTSVTDTGIYINDFNISKNGVYTLRLTDKYRNISNYSFSINEIDTVTPAVGIIANKDNLTLTNSDVILAINATDDTLLSKVEIIDSINGTKVFTVSEKSFSTNYIVSENSSITVKVIDKSGNTSSAKYIVTNINKITPSISDNYSNIDYADLETSFKVKVDLEEESSNSLGKWTIESNGSYTYRTLNTSETEIDITAQKNQIIKIKFTDIWGNESNELIITVDNIIDGIVKSDLMYVTTITDFLKQNPGMSEIEVMETREVYNLNSSKYTNNIPVNFVKISTEESTIYPAYAYIFILDSHKQISMIENKTNNPNVDILNDHEALFKFTEQNKTITFYLKDIFNHYTINRLNVSKIASDIKSTITSTQDIEYVTDKSVNVLFKINFGHFEDNFSLYQYYDGNVLKSYYDDFVWVEEIKNTDDYSGDIYTFEGIDYKEIQIPTNISDRTMFVYTFKKNASFKIWAVDSNDGWISKIAYVTNIDKIAPTISIDPYEMIFPNSLTITAHTNDIFYTASELSQDSFYDKFDLSGYSISADKKTATITFTESNNTFRFKAHDKAGNESYSDFVNVEIYLPKVEYSLELINPSTGIEEEISIDNLNNLRTNKDINIYINITSENGQFIEDLNADYEYINEKRLKVTLFENGIYNVYSKDSYDNTNLYSLEVIDVINKKEPDVSINIIKNNDGKYLSSIDIEVTSDKIVSYKIFTDSEVVSEIIDKNLKYTFNVTSNGIYYIEALDVYGNVSLETIEINGIFMKQDRPKIYVSQYNLTPTNKDIELTLTVENGKFADWSKEDFISINEDATEMKYIITNNKTINVSAVNYYDYENLEKIELDTLTSLISSNITVSNIDKIAPFKPSYITYLNDDGLITYKFFDNGDIGFGTTGFNYNITNGVYKDFNSVGKEKTVGINQNDGLYTDDNYNLKVYSFDKAGNTSEVEEHTIYSNNKIVNNFMTTYNAAINDLTNNNLTDEKKTLYLLESEDTENNLNILMNIEQKEFLSSKINNFRTFLGDVEIEEQRLILEIEEYFNRLKLNFRDNSFMPELLIKINLIKTESLKSDYITLYNYYKELIENTFIDTTITEFNYTDSNGNILNPLSGYVLNSAGVYGYYSSEKAFIEGSNNQLYYYNSEGALIQLDYYKKSYTDGNGNVVKVLDGVVNELNYYNNDGTLLDFKKFLEGFYDFQGIWHNRGSEIPVLNPQYIEEIENPEDVTPTPTPGETTPTPTPNPGDVTPTPTPTPTPNPGDVTPIPTPGETTPTPIPSDTVLAQSITLSTNSLELLVGKNALIIATVLPKNATDKSITWSSNNTTVATIDSTGRISAISEGTAIITAKTNNNIVSSLTLYVNKTSSVVDSTEKVIKVNPIINYPTIDEIVSKNDSDKITYKLPLYNTLKVGNINYATVSNNNLTEENYLALKELGFSTVLYNGFTTIKTLNASKADIGIGMGNNNFRVEMSSKDISNDGMVTELKISNSGNKFTLDITGKNNLGNNSKIYIYSNDENKLVYYNDKMIKASYDNTLNAYIINNPLSGTYNIGDRQASGYNMLDTYNLVNNNISKTDKITYTNIIIMVYNSLNEDDFKDLYSNIEESYSLYREVSILQRHGILGKTIDFNNQDKISGKNAFDIIYLTLSNLTSDTLNYDNSSFIKLKEISLSDINNMVKTITEK